MGNSVAKEINLELKDLLLHISCQLEAVVKGLEPNDRAWYHLWIGHVPSAKVTCAMNFKAWKCSRFRSSTRS